MEQVAKFIRQLGQELKSIIKTCMELAWFSRGGFSYEQILAMSAGERDIAVDVINERIEAAGKMMHPVF